MNCKASYFMLSLLVVGFLVLYLYVDNGKLFKRTETFTDQSSASFILPPEKLSVLQGNSLPTVATETVQWDTDPSATSVDGTASGPKQMFMFAYNKASPECCPSPFSTSRGCVCMSDDQIKYISQRGKNSNYNKCSPSEF